MSEKLQVMMVPLPALERLVAALEDSVIRQDLVNEQITARNALKSDKVVGETTP